jgi:isopentenyl diphosphate isomerase/L-lactate dehydrogenase-like FMN-dependent dehydrogenase
VRAGYYASGAESEASLNENRDALRRYRLLPRVLVDVTSVDTRCQLLGALRHPDPQHL